MNTIGPVMIDLQGTTLEAEEAEMLKHPQVGGLIYFTRNFESQKQIAELSRQVRQACPRPILICVDHEGGRVQRFRKDFTVLPACRRLGKLFDEDKASAINGAKAIGWLMAAELIASDIDFSFAPVLDLDYGESEVIGDRAFHSDKHKVADLSIAYIQGMHAAGMKSTGKHFPGHGYVKADSHLELPRDSRSLTEIQENDMWIFEQVHAAKCLDAVMPAHVIYEQADSQCAGFSSYWIQKVLRQQMRFNGVVFSDDLNMAAAHVAGSFTDRAHLALEAGCDMVLVCNNRDGAIEVLDNLDHQVSDAQNQRLHTMRGNFGLQWSQLGTSDQWRQALAAMEKLP